MRLEAAEFELERSQQREGQYQSQFEPDAMTRTYDLTRNDMGMGMGIDMGTPQYESRGGLSTASSMNACVLPDEIRPTSSGGNAEIMFVLHDDDGEEDNRAAVSPSLSASEDYHNPPPAQVMYRPQTAAAEMGASTSQFRPSLDEHERKLRSVSMEERKRSVSFSDPPEAEGGGRGQYPSEHIAMHPK